MNNDEALRKWNPVFDSLDPKQILDQADRGYLAEFAEHFSFAVIQNEYMSLPTGLDTTALLPAFLKSILDLKTKYKFNFVFDNLVPSGQQPVDVILGDFNKPVYTITDGNIYFNTIIEKLEEIYANNNVIVHHLGLILMATGTLRPIPTVRLNCTLVPTDIQKQEDVEVKAEKNFQECAHLEIEDVFATSKNTLEDLYNLQKDIQENVYGFDFEKMQEGPLPELRSFFDWNYHAIQDELRETFDALGGMSDGIGNGVWKPWKKAYTEKAPNMSLNDMSERDKKELKMELIDIQHFVFNMMLAVGMTPEELMNYYFAKNQENRDRQTRGY